MFNAAKRTQNPMERSQGTHTHPEHQLQSGCRKHRPNGQVLSGGHRGRTKEDACRCLSMGRKVDSGGSQRTRGRMLVPGERPVQDKVATDKVSQRDVTGIGVTGCFLTHVPSSSQGSASVLLILPPAVFSRKCWPTVL